MAKPHSDRRAPDLDRETPDDADADLLAGIALGLRQRHSVEAVVEGRRGAGALVLAALMRAEPTVGVERKAHEILVFGRGDDDAVVDALDGIVGDIAAHGGPDKGRFLPLDWEGRPWGDGVVFVRGEVRDYLAEEEAAKLLNEPPPPRGLRRPLVH